QLKRRNELLSYLFTDNTFASEEADASPAHKHPHALLDLFVKERCDQNPVSIAGCELYTSKSV
ncbi:hypothetical protein, partial [Teredinibacter turnerae]|uniref:hypothetical protein n=1 Tax=Teredinibacter turnerae TaxID=2426 RepID=UPI001E487783